MGMYAHLSRLAGRVLRYCDIPGMLRSKNANVG